MKETIKLDRERKIIRDELLDDNTLLEVTSEKGKITISVRFVESPITGIKEHTIISMPSDKYLLHMDKVLLVSEAKDAIATFTPTEEGYLLRDVYDVKEHSFVPADFTDLIYRKSFPNNQLQKRMLKINK